MNRTFAHAAAGVLGLLATGSGVAQTNRPPSSPSAAIARNDAEWAEWQADKRLTEGDYDGAIQSQGRADADRRAAARMDAYARGADPRR